MITEELNGAGFSEREREHGEAVVEESVGLVGSQCWTTGAESHRLQHPAVGLPTARLVRMQAQ